jgi:prevent-host-death family protein
MMQVNVLEARNRLSQLIKAAESGVEVVIARRGVPIIRLVPVGVTSPESGSGVAGWLAAHPLPAHARRSPAQLKADFAADRSAWD